MNSKVKRLYMNKNNVSDLAPTVLVGTYRIANEEWIKESKLYNLPLPVGYHFEQYKTFTHIILFGRNNEPLAYKAKFKSVESKEWLRKNGYKISASPHGVEYVIFALERKVKYNLLLSDPTADVFVCSAVFTGRIDKDFYERPLPDCEGRSVPNIFDKLKPFVQKWHSAYSFNPVQTDFLHAMLPNKPFPVVGPLEYVEGAIQVHREDDEKLPPTFNLSIAEVSGQGRRKNLPV